MIVSFPSISITFLIVGLFLPLRSHGIPLMSCSTHGNPHDSYMPHMLILNVGVFGEEIYGAI